MPSKLFDGKTYHLCVDQHGQKLYARSVKELKQLAGPGRAFRIYVDKQGQTYHCGYGVGERWFSVFAPLYVKV